MYTKFKYQPKFGMVAPVINNLFHEVVNGPVKEMINDHIQKQTHPVANIYEYEGKYEIVLAIPGFQKEDISINVENNHLLVKGENKSQAGVKYKHLEFNHNQFKRSFKLSDKLDSNSITASYTNGLLTITILKSETAKVKNVEIS